MQTHFIRIRDFAGKNDRTSMISSSGRITGDAATSSGEGMIFMRTV
ncbi:hypothetical protein A2U01_0057309, partial [Trifolium medium]|nr:hypothetical protein [Trifolium medium]